MQFDKLHIQYHPDHDAVFITHLPDRTGAKTSNHGHALDRDGEFWFSLYNWARRATSTPPVLAWLRKRVPVLRPKTTDTTRVWEHPEGLMRIEVRIIEVVEQ